MRFLKQTWCFGNTIVTARLARTSRRLALPQRVHSVHERLVEHAAEHAAGADYVISAAYAADERLTANPYLCFIV